MRRNSPWEMGTVPRTRRRTPPRQVSVPPDRRLLPSSSKRQTPPVTEDAWTWDPSLYAGSATHYVRGRIAYSPDLVDALVGALALDGTGRLLDVGCGPGSLTLPLARFFDQVTGVDADLDMLSEATRQAAAGDITNVAWVHLRAEALPADLGTYTVVTLAQSFHWMDRPHVARTLRGMLFPGGALVHVHATTHQGVDSDAGLPYPGVPRAEIDDLVKRYLGPRRRAGQGTRGVVVTGTGAEVGEVEGDIYRAAGFTDRIQLEVPGHPVVRDADSVVSSVFSLSGAAPHLFDDDGTSFEADLRELLRATSPDGTFSEQMRESALDIWRVSP